MKPNDVGSDPRVKEELQVSKEFLVNWFVNIYPCFSKKRHKIKDFN